MLKKLSQMKNLKLLNRKCFIIFLFSFFISLNVQSQEPIDIWSIEEKSNTNKVLNTKMMMTKKFLRTVFMKCNLKVIVS